MLPFEFRGELLAEGGEIPDLLGPDKVIRLLPTAQIDAIPRDRLRLWCHQHARYTIMTLEMIEWLRDFIGDRSALEIGSGHGDLAHHLGIRGTDNWCQTFPDVKEFYRVTGQPTIEYPQWVEKIDGLKAVWKHKPQVVLGSWVTHWINPRKNIPEGGGNMYGVEEDRLLKTGVTYCMIGNLETHGYKPILKRPHEEIRLPFLRSRALHPELDRVFIWHGRR